MTKPEEVEQQVEALHVTTHTLTNQDADEMLRQLVDLVQWWVSSASFQRGEIIKMDRILLKQEIEDKVLWRLK